MQLSEKQKKIFSSVSSLSIFWFLMAIGNSVKNHEYAGIVESISNANQLGQCSIKTNVERDWPFGWTPGHMAVLVTKEGQKASISTSRFMSPPDRVQLSPSYTRFRFRWSKRVNGNLEVSYMDVDIDSSNEVKKLVLGGCSNYPEATYNWNDMIKEECLVDVKVIECS